MSVTIANVPLTLTQRGRPGSCTVTTGAFTLVGHGGGAVCAPVTFPERQDCFWEVLDVPAWATLSAGARVGDGEVCVTLAANTSWEARTASIRVNVPSWGPTFMLLTQERDPSWTIVEPRSSGNDYLWKPRSDSDGKLVVALPPAFKNSIDKVELHRTIPMGAGTYIERGGFAGLANGDRSYFRFDHAGSSYSDGLYVVVFRSAGRKVAYHIPNTSGTYYYN